jgi:hypothetical protein
MPITLTIDTDKRVVYSALHGVITEAEFLAQPQRILAHPAFDPSFSEIIDLRGITDVQVSPETIRNLAMTQSIFSRESKHALISPSGLILDFARMFQANAEQTRPDMVIVKTPAEAYEYLRQQT